MIALRQTDFPEPVVPAMSRWGMAVRSATTDWPDTSWPSANRRGDSILANASDSITSRRATTETSGLGTSMPTSDLPGIGASMRRVRASIASARSFAAADMRLTLTFISRPFGPVTTRGSMPNCVTTGPRLISMTLTGSPRLPSASSIVRA